MGEAEFINELNKIGIKITEKQREQFKKYYELLVEYNKKTNLTRIIKKEDVYLKHFYDSLTIIKIIKLNQIQSLCDIGTGAGFPGIVLKIVFPTIKITLIDSLNKRIEFLKHIINELELKEINAIHARAEEYSIKNKEKYDLVCSRAVAKLSVLAEISAQLIIPGKYLIAMKANIEEEIKNTTYLEKIGLKIKKIETFYLPKEKSLRNLVLIQKVKSTPKIYPRKYSDIIKKPL